MRERLQKVPLKPGVYIFKDREGRVLYVGKARSLRSRMRSYFQAPEKLDPKVRAMMARVADFDYIVTSSELEALILENNLIKSYQPRYNIRLRDDKTYPYLKITMSDKYPRLALVREDKDGRSRYFGPYVDVASLRETIKILNTIFPLRKCKTLHPNKRPCLNYDIKLCLAPCAGMVKEDEYRRVVEELVAFLEGSFQGLLQDKEEQMKNAAARLDFEAAAFLRDQINGIKKIQQNQQIDFEKSYNLDIAALVGLEKERLAVVFKIRQGRIVAKDTFWLQRSIDENESELMAFFIQQYYKDNSDIPGEILLSLEPSDPELLQTWLSEGSGKRVKLQRPSRGERRRMLDLVLNNARLLWEEKAEKNLQNREALLRLSQVLELEIIPERIEAYDISHLGGAETVASMVVFSDGIPDPKAYRRFKIRSDQNDDYASMAEVLERRLNESRHGNAAFLPEPDLILIDGGAGQVKAAYQVLEAVGKDIPVVGLAKKNEWLFRPEHSEPLVLPRRDPGLMLLQRLRDEAHRFANEYNRQRRSKKLQRSSLDDIPGIGPQRKKSLLTHFVSGARIREASLDDLRKVPGMNLPAARAVYNYYHPDSRIKDE
jgi:excinuclease ABC subunit C